MEAHTHHMYLLHGQQFSQFLPPIENKIKYYQLNIKKDVCLKQEIPKAQCCFWKLLVGKGGELLLPIVVTCSYLWWGGG